MNDIQLKIRLLKPLNLICVCVCVCVSYLKNERLTGWIRALFNTIGCISFIFHILNKHESGQISFYRLNFFLQNLVRVWRMNCLSNVQYSNLTFLLLICSSNNREFAATIKRPFEVRYDPYTSSVDVLKSPRDVCDVINNVRDELTILMQVLVKLQAKFDNWSEEKNSLHFLIIKCCNVSLLFMSNAHYTIGLRSDFVDKNVR